MSCASYIVLLMLGELVVLFWYHVSVMADKEGEIAELKEKLKPRRFVEDEVGR